MKTCPVCEGTGQQVGCRACGYAGFVVNPDDHGDDIECPECKGWQRCETCQGRGEIESERGRKWT